MNRKENKISKKDKKSFQTKNKEHFITKKEIKKKYESIRNKNRREQFKSETKINLNIKTDLISNINKIHKETQTILTKKRSKNKKINTNKKAKESKSVINNVIKTTNEHTGLNTKNNIENNVKNNQDNKTISPNKNLTIKINNPSPTKSKNTSNEKLIFLDKYNHTIVSKSKETISTNLDTISTEKEKNEENFEEIKNTIKAIFTPIPSLMKKTSKATSNQQPNLKDVEKAIKLRRQQYNEYLKSLNKSKPKLKPKPKVYDLNSVIFIQKIYKAYQVKDVIQKVNRLKINLCVTELFCLIFNHVFKHAKKRVTFYMFKTYYHDPFTNIFNEVDFSDKLMMKLSDTYYNFNNFFRSY